MQQTCGTGQLACLCSAAAAAQAEIVAGSTALGSFGCLGAVLACRARLPAVPLAQPVADMLTRAAVRQAFVFLGLLRQLVSPPQHIVQSTLPAAHKHMMYSVCSMSAACLHACNTVCSVAACGCQDGSTLQELRSPGMHDLDWAHCSASAGT